MPVPVQYPKWVGSVIVNSVDEELALLGDAFVPFDPSPYLDGAVDPGTFAEYPKWVGDVLVNSAEEEAALAPVEAVPDVAHPEETPEATDTRLRRQGRPPLPRDADGNIIRPGA